MAALYPRPAELGHLPRDRSTVIEASAGTGKTYLLEHLVLDRILDGDTRIENILVVTFTDKGAAELTRRLPAAIDRLLRVAAGAQPPVGAGGAPLDPARCWRLDSGPVARPQPRRPSFAPAPTPTIPWCWHQVVPDDATPDQLRPAAAATQAGDRRLRGLGRRRRPAVPAARPRRCRRGDEESVLVLRQQAAAGSVHGRRRAAAGRVPGPGGYRG